MTVYILPNKEKIQAGKGFTYKDYQYPNNWTMMDGIIEKLKAKEITQEKGKDSRFYNNSWDAEGKWTGSKKSLDDRLAVDANNKPIKNQRTGKQEIHLGVVSTLINDIKNKQMQMLSSTDHWYIRKADIGEEVPAKIQKWRDAIRKDASKWEEQVKKAKSIEELEALNLYNWSELEE